MSNLVEWAEKELQRLGDSESEMQQLMNNNVLEIVKIFSEQGHSGFTASYALNLIKRLLSWKPITPLTGDESEWTLVHDDTYQNNRRSTVFRKGRDNNTAYDIEGKIFSDDGGETWFTNRDSHVPIKFPYVIPDEPQRVYLGDEKL